jgi:peptidoglycan/LPS O-acetylase OafA/YrhL
MQAARGRIEFLDGLRGLAILMVVLWHVYGTTYAEHLPYGDHYAILPIRDFWVGVELFFLISGFVIAMSLEKCETLFAFSIKRWLRLFPAMLVASLLILAYDMSVGAGPLAQRSFVNLIPGLLFISPSIIHTLTGFSIDSMDGPFWSLYVEVSFYFVFGFLYFRYGLLVAIGLIFSSSVLACAMGYAANLGFGGSLFGRIAGMLDWLGIVHFGWFASGAIFYEYFRTRRRRHLFLAICSGCLAALDWKIYSFSTENRVALLFVVVFFALAVCSVHTQKALSIRALIFFGFISYPLYLVHDNIVVGLTQLLGRNIPGLSPYLYPVTPIVLVTAVAFVIARYLEPAIRRLLQAWLALIPRRVLLSRATEGYVRQKAVHDGAPRGDVIVVPLQSISQTGIRREVEN